MAKLRCRRTFSLFTDRWRTSSRVVTVLTLLALIFCNVPGQSVTRMKYVIGHPFYVESQFEHGWPLTYLIRANEGGEGRHSFVYSLSPPPAENTLRDCFALWTDCAGFRPWMLVANGCMVLLASIASGVAFEAWRRQRRHLWHIHLRDCFMVTLALALAVAWYAHARRRHFVEETVFVDSSLGVSHYQLGGITWLRMCLDDETFRYFDRPFAVVIHERDGWSHLDKLTSVHHVDAQVSGTTEDVAHLAELPRLEALSLDGAFDARTDSVITELPPLVRLRGLFLTQPTHRYRRLDRLTSLESLRVTEDCIDEQVLREIGTLPNLREVALNGLTASADLSFLASRPQLSALDLYNSEVSVAALRSIGGCFRLKNLSFYMCRLDASGVRHLSRLAGLDKLNLEYTNVTDGDLAALVTLKQLREFDLTRTKVGGDLNYMSALEHLESLRLYDTEVNGSDMKSLVGLAHLRSLDLGYTSIGSNGFAYVRQMKQLRWLRVSCDADELRALQRALPECSIIRH